MREWKDEVRRRLTSLRLAPEREAEIVEELAQHLEDRYQELVAGGAAEGAARRLALNELSDEHLLARGLRRVEHESPVDPPAASGGLAGYWAALRDDLRYGLRQLRRTPAMTLIAVLSLALGIGANTAIFDLIDALLLKTLPVANPHQLVLLDWVVKGWPEGVVNSINGNVNQDKTGRMTSTSFGYPAYEQLRAGNHIFSDLFAVAANESQLNVGYKGEPGRATGNLVTGSFFTTLGVEPILGRVIAADDDRIGASPAAMISYGYWERRFGRDPAILGQKITVNAAPFTIVGVTPAEFYGVKPGLTVDLWMPIHTQPAVEPSWSYDNATGTPKADILFTARDNWWVLVMGRLKPGVSEQQAPAELDLIFQQSMSPDVKPGTKAELLPHVEVQPGDKGLDDLRSEFSKPLLVLMIVVGLVLLIACANVANLLLARATARQQEFAVRLAMGASRGRLIRQLATESALLAGLGGALGLILAFWSTRAVLAFMSGGREPISLNVTPGLDVLGFTAGISFFTAILFGLSPALRSTRVDLTPALKESSRRLTNGFGSRHGLRFGFGKMLVVAQIAISLLLLVGAGLFLRTLINLQKVDLGFDQRNLLLFTIDPTQDGYKEQRLVDFYQEMSRRLQALPGVEAVSLSAHRLIAGGSSIHGAHIPGYTPPGKKNAEVHVWVNRVGPDFFKAMGIPIIAGRAFSEADAGRSPKVAIANQTFARKYLGGENALGRRLGLGNEDSESETEIVGIAGDAKYASIQDETPPTAYEPYLQHTKYLGGMSFELRTAGEPEAIAPAVRRVARDMDPNLALYDMRTQTEQVSKALFQERLFARLTSFFGLLAALLGCIGVYGIMAFATNQRTHEIGIRMALGAGSGKILNMVMRETLLMVIAGTAIGILAAYAGTRSVASFLFGLKATDVTTYFAAAMLFALVALLAGYWPARRASRVDPMVALRYE